MSPEDVVKIAAYIIGPAGAAWVGVKGSLNGMRNQIKALHASDIETRQELADLGTTCADTQERIAHIEGRLFTVPTKSKPRRR